LREYSYLLYASQTIKRAPQDLHVGLLTSFGFGQVGGIVMILHPNHLFARLSAEDYKEYEAKRQLRQAKTYTKMHSAITKNDLVQVKNAPPYSNELEDKVLMNSNARATEVNGSYAFKEPLAAPIAYSYTKGSQAVKQEKNLESIMGHVAGIGIDCESVAQFPSENENFVKKNFTEEEIKYCRAQPDPRASFCGRFCSKEAVFKSMGVKSQGLAASLIDIEIIASAQGPTVKLSDQVKDMAKGYRFLISISHNDGMAVAVAHRVPL
jgi:phosphopantetheine--protein transferase-like protein